MIITRNMLNNAISENKALFHNGDIITNEVFQDLILAPKVKKMSKNGHMAMMLPISKEQREVLCSEMTSRNLHVRSCMGDYIFFEKKCQSCGEIIKIPLTRTQIIHNTFKIEALVKHQFGCPPRHGHWYADFITYEELYKHKYGEGFICRSCYEKIIEYIDKETYNLLAREDKFEWFMSNENSDDWKKRLFVKQTISLAPGLIGCKIKAIDGSEWVSDSYKTFIYERKKREEEHNAQLKKEKAKRLVDESMERQRVERSNELFLSRHQISSPTQNYINKFCDKNSNIDIYDQNVQQEALCPVNVEYEAIQKHNCTSYKDYLLTPLWRIISSKVKWNAHNRCERCNSENNLEVHHLSYEFKGVEFLAMETLICLCSVCHDKEHDKGNT